jgi:opacity protein-like surface antigen
MHLALRMPVAAGLLFVCSFLGSIAHAQDDNQQEAAGKSQPDGPRSTLIGPVSIGFRTGILIGNLVDAGSAFDTDTGVTPFRTTEVSAESMSSHVGWGPVLQLSFTKRIVLNVDLLHRGVGYDVTTVIDEATDVDEAQFVSERFETISAKFWDLALLPRYRFGDPGKPRPYVTGGFALRSLSKERGSVQTTDEEGNFETADLDVQPANTVVRGAAIGAGVQIQDDVGFKLELEFRYTRWFRRTFDSGVANSMRNQAEILVGLTF